MSGSNVISEFSIKNKIHNFNYLNNKKYNVIVKNYMKKITVLKNKKNVSFFNIKNVSVPLKNIFKTIRDKKLISIIERVEKNFV